MNRENQEGFMSHQLKCFTAPSLPQPNHRFLVLSQRDTRRPSLFIRPFAKPHSLFQMEHKRGDAIHDQRVGTEKNAHSHLSSLNRTACAGCKKCSESSVQNIHLKEALNNDPWLFLDSGRIRLCEAPCEAVAPYSEVPQGFSLY